MAFEPRYNIVTLRSAIGSAELVTNTLSGETGFLDDSVAPPDGDENEDTDEAHAACHACCSQSLTAAAPAEGTKL